MQKDKMVYIAAHHGKNESHVVTDKVGTPTYTHDFAKNTKALLEAKLLGLYSMVCDRILGIFKVVKVLVSILDLEDKAMVTAVDSDCVKRLCYAERPPSEKLINKKFNFSNMNNMRP